MWNFLVYATLAHRVKKGWAVADGRVENASGCYGAVDELQRVAIFGGRNSVCRTTQYCSMVAFQHSLGSGDPEFLQVSQGAVAGSLLEAPNEVADAHPASQGAANPSESRTSRILAATLPCEKGF